MSEEWRPVPDYEGLYEVSDHGRVRSLERVVMHGGNPMRVHERILSPVPMSKREHLMVSLSREGRVRKFPVHGLVLTAFVGPRPAGQETCHYDGDPTNNHLGNLRWDTRTGNVRDAVRHVRLAQMRRTECPRGHRLAAPNLRPKLLAQGHRLCLACHRADAAWRRAKRRGLPFDMQAESDEHFARILHGASA